MAREKLRAIGEEEAARHGLCAVALVHRTGRVPLTRAVGDRRRLARRTAARRSPAPAR